MKIVFGDVYCRSTLICLMACTLIAQTNGNRFQTAPLPKIGKTTSADFGLLREALSNTISAGIHSAGLNTLQREDTDCVNGYLLTMSAFDDPAWQSFPYSYSGIVYATEGNWGGGSVFWKV